MNWITLANETTEIDCSGHFKTQITVSHNANETLTLDLSTANVDNIDGLTQNARTPQVPANASITVRFTGDLKDPEEEGSFQFAFEGKGNTVKIDQDQVKIVIPEVPIRVKNEPDPVTADPSGAFTFDAEVHCQGQGRGARNVDYETFAGGNVAALAATPPSPMVLNCPGGKETATVNGLLADPRKPGVVRFNFTTGEVTCVLLVDINPSGQVDWEAHFQAIEEWWARVREEAERRAEEAAEEGGAEGGEGSGD